MSSGPAFLATIAVAAIAVGGIFHALGAGESGHVVWRAAVALLAAELAYEVAHTIVVDHHVGVATIALVAMVGALALGQELATTRYGKSRSPMCRPATSSFPKRRGIRRVLARMRATPAAAAVPAVPDERRRVTRDGPRVAAGAALVHAD